MDPISVLKTLWRHKWVALPVVMLTVVACVYVMFIAQRTYQATMTYALITPKMPTAAEMEKNPQLANVNGDNPYLRSPDSTLLSQVLITKLGGQDTVQRLQQQGLGTEYTVSQASTFGSGMLLQISASGTSPQQAVETAMSLGKQLTTTLHDVQKINGADESYLYSALAVDGPGQAKEMFSSRLRTLIIVAVAGAVLVFGAVSIARSLELASARRRIAGRPAKHAGRGEPEPEQQEAAGVRPSYGPNHGRSDDSSDEPSDFRFESRQLVTVPDREDRT
ncbi:Wzz/FepE/Etk N-terminal domain-containing protein [Arthrobacter sp. 92]|jgi:hypothetical protein|uniref:Wzz/FepE/Etk N-terminal domain-containing protein n=1 Tax=Arthrobacter sp. 92 TaxID=3418175 RepID=UPI0006A875DD|nr:hypothetical protein AHiyo6_15240 [Arthrobacter sp. Hiyo6]